MSQFFNRLWREDDAVLTFDWVLLVTIVVIGIISGLTAVRDAVIDEFGDITEATISWDQSYSFAGIPALGLPPSSYTDTAQTYSDCGRLGP